MVRWPEATPLVQLFGSFVLHAHSHVLGMQKHSKFGIWGLTPDLFGITLHVNWPFKTKETQLVEVFLRKLSKKG